MNDDLNLTGQNLGTIRIGKKIIVLQNTASTNDVAAAYADNPENDGLVVFAEQQTAGRGRRGNRWFSQPGQSILCSVLVHRRSVSSEMLTIACAVAVTKAIGPIAGVWPMIKWPNDILLAGKKVAGILVELVSASDRVVIGIGINCHQNQSGFPPELHNKATSIDIVAGRFCDRPAIARRMLIELDHWLDAAEKSPHEVIENWKSSDILFGKRIELVCNSKIYKGTCIGIDPDEGIFIRLDSGKAEVFNAKQSTINIITNTHIN